MQKAGVKEERGRILMIVEEEKEGRKDGRKRGGKDDKWKGRRLREQGKKKKGDRRKEFSKIAKRG